MYNYCTRLHACCTCTDTILLAVGVGRPITVIITHCGPCTQQVQAHHLPYMEQVQSAMCIVVAMCTQAVCPAYFGVADLHSAM